VSANRATFTSATHIHKQSIHKHQLSAIAATFLRTFPRFLRTGINLILNTENSEHRPKCIFSRCLLTSLSDDTSRCDVATFVNSYPTLDEVHELVKGEYTAGSPIILKVTLARDSDDGDDNNQTVAAPFYPHKKLANWRLVVGDPQVGNYSSSRLNSRFIPFYWAYSTGLVFGRLSHHYYFAVDFLEL
jgi:hypothetical protein